MRWYKQQLFNMTESQLWQEWDRVTAPFKDLSNNKPVGGRKKKIERSHIGGKVFS